MNTIIRIIHKNTLPERTLREGALQNHFGGQLSFVDWTPPENPGELFDSLREKLIQTEAVAIELDTDDKQLTALVGVGVVMLAFQIPAMHPTPHLKTVPVLISIFTEGHLAGYAELADVQLVANERTDIKTA